MQQETDHVKRIAELEASLATEKHLHYLATRLIGERDAKLEAIGNRVATLEELLCDLANAVSIHRICPSNEHDDKEMAKAQDRAQAFLHSGEAKGEGDEGHGAITATAIRVARQVAFGEAAQLLLKMAFAARPMGLADAAKIIADLAKKDTKNAGETTC